MIITQTPFRMSFFGGGTDIPQYFNSNRGAVISTTFNKYCYVTVRHLPRFFDYTSEFSYSEVERVSYVNEIRHPAIREAMKMLDMREIRMTYEADLPARSGLGTSSSFAVGLLYAFYALKEKYIDKRKLAEEAIHLERYLCNELGGWQDQVAASYGGFNRINFYNGSFEVNPIIISEDRKNILNKHLMLFFTGFSRYSSDIQKSTSQNIDKNSQNLDEMLNMVDEAQHILTDKTINLDEFGVLLNYSWKLKRQMGKEISSDAIDMLYNRAINAGAVGGKLLGAGGGGFLLLYVKPENQKSVRDELNELMHVPFEFENHGSRVIYYSSESFNLIGN